MAGGDTLTFTDASFEPDVLRSDVPVLVDFWADSCPPCHQIMTNQRVTLAADKQRRTPERSSGRPEGSSRISHYLNPPYNRGKCCPSSILWSPNGSKRGS
jgi:thiol-disulfide isomerase/thioredoxin